ncbi:MAG TPA: hypothetical protein VIL35_07150 [Vicinamibacterales bacterium]
MADEPIGSRLQRSTSPGATDPPEQAQPGFMDPGLTGELASEGGSYGDAIQEQRARANAAGDSAAQRSPDERSTSGLVWLLLGVPLAIIVLWFATSVTSC